MIERIKTGMMGLNIGVVSNAAAPFGGWKMSGLGREGGAEGIHEYLQTKYTLTPTPFGYDRCMQHISMTAVNGAHDTRHRSHRGEGPTTMTSLSSHTAHPLAMTTTDDVLAVRRILSEAGLLGDASRIAYLGLEEPTPTELRSGTVDRRFRVMIQDVSTGVGHGRRRLDRHRDRGVGEDTERRRRRATSRAGAGIRGRRADPGHR